MSTGEIVALCLGAEAVPAIAVLLWVVAKRIMKQRDEGIRALARSYSELHDLNQLVDGLRGDALASVGKLDAALASMVEVSVAMRQDLKLLNENLRTFTTAIFSVGREQPDSAVYAYDEATAARAEDARANERPPVPAPNRDDAVTG